MYQLITEEKYLDELIENLESLDFHNDFCEVNIFHEKEYYTVIMYIEDKSYRVRDANMTDKTVLTYYKGDDVLRYLPTSQFVSIEKDNNIKEIIPIENLPYIAYPDMGFDENQTKTLTKSNEMLGFFNNIKNMSKKEDDYSPTSITSTYEKIKENKEIYELYIEYKEKENKLIELRKKNQSSDNSPYISFTNNIVNIFDFFKNINSYVDKETEEVDFIVDSNETLKDIVKRLSYNEYTYNLYNSNIHAHRRTGSRLSPSTHVLIAHNHFSNLANDYYKYKIFTVNLNTKNISYWEEANSVFTDTFKNKSKNVLAITSQN